MQQTCTFTYTGWTLTPSPVVVQTCQESVGPTVPISRNPLEMFSIFFDEEVLDVIVRETNRYASQVLEGSEKTWETDVQEIRAYLGFRILMGINRKPEIRDYWSKDEKLHYIPIASRITRDRFEEVTRYLHFVDNSSLPGRGEDGYHRLQKVLPILSMIKERFLKTYNPHPQNSIDEAMIPYKGTKAYVCICSCNLCMYTCTCTYMCRPLNNETVHANEACEARLQSMGESRCCEWVLL